APACPYQRQSPGRCSVARLERPSTSLRTRFARYPGRSLSGALFPGFARGSSRTTTLALLLRVRAVQGAPDALRRQRHLQAVRGLAQARARECVDDRIDHRRCRPDRPKLAHTLNPERVVEAGDRCVGRRPEMRYRGRPRQRVVLEARRQRLPGLAVVHELLAQRLAQALDCAAFELSLHDLRIHDGADVIDRTIRDWLDRARVGIDLDFTDMTAVGPSRAGNRARRIDAELRLRLRVRQLEKPDPAIGADDL